MIYLSKVIKNFTSNNNVINDDNPEEEQDNDNEVLKKQISLRVLINKMCRLASFEAIHAIKESLKVSFSFLNDNLNDNTDSFSNLVHRSFVYLFTHILLMNWYCYCVG